MNISFEDLDSFAEAQLESLRPVPPRRAERAAQGREAFLTQARQLRQQAPLAALPTSPSPNGRPRGWMATVQPLFRKSRPLMLKPVFALLVALSLVFGSVVVTSAAQNSLPGAPFYNVKLLTEDVRLGLATRPKARLSLALAFSERRVNEIMAQQQLGRPVSGEVGSRWQQELDQGLQAAAGMPDDELRAALQQIRLELQQQAHMLQQSGGQGVTEQIQRQIREYLDLVEAGLQDPQQFRRQWQAVNQQKRQQQQQEAPVPTGPPGSGASSPSTSSQTGGSGAGQPQETATPCKGCGAPQPGGRSPGSNQGQPQPGSSSSPGQSQSAPKPGKGSPPGLENPHRPPQPPGQEKPKQKPETGNGSAKCSVDCSGSENINGQGGPGNGNGSGNAKAIGLKRSRH